MTAEETTWLFLQSFGTALRNEFFVHDVKLSDRIPESAAQLGALPAAQPSGYAFLRASMIRSGAIFGAEISGHCFFRELQAGDDGLHTACRMISHLAGGEQTLADQRRCCPETCVTPDLRLAMEAVTQPEIMRQIRNAFEAFPQNHLDGVRIEYPDGWALIRRSVTEAALTFRFEAGARPILTA